MLRLASAGVIFGIMVTSAAAANVDYAGMIQISKVAATPGCVENGTQVGDMFFAMFRPPNLGTNGPSTYLTIIQNYATGAGAQNAALTSGSLVGTAFKSVSITQVFKRGGGPYTATMRFTSQVPAAPTDSTPAISIVGDWTNLGGDGCTVGFAGTVLKN